MAQWCERFNFGTKPFAAKIVSERREEGLMGSVGRRPSTSYQLTPAVRRIAVVVILGSGMTFLDSTIVNIALRPLSETFHDSLATTQWVITSYLLALAAVIPITGWAARRLGPRRLYLITLALFIVGSALCGLAQSSVELIVFRALQGLGGGMIMPAGQILLAREAGPRNMTRVMSLVGTPMVLAPILGPTIGGLLLETLGWRWIFFVNIPVGVAALVAGVFLLPREPAEDAGPLDVPGLGLVAVGLVALTYGLSEIGTDHPFVSTAVLAPIAGGLVLLTAFAARSWRIPRPLLDVRLYRNGAFSAASVATFCLGAVLYGGMILMPIYYQVVRHQSEVLTGLLLIPQGIGTALTMRLSGQLCDRIGGGLTAVFGCLVIIAASTPFILIHQDTPYVLLCMAMFARGLGAGLASMPSMTAAYKVLTPAQINDATPQLNVLQRVGASLGTAILTVVLQQRLDRAGTDGAAQAHAFGVTFAVVTAITVVVMLSTVTLAVIERRMRRAESSRVASGALVPAPGAPAGSYVREPVLIEAEGGLL